MDMVMTIVIMIAILAILGCIGWLIYRAVKRKPLKAHHVTYGITIVAGIYTYGFFLSMDIPTLVKILVSIILGMLVIILAALLQRRQKTTKH